MKKILALCVVLSALWGSAAGADTPAQLKFMAGPPGGNWFALGGELADLWSKEVMPTTSVTGGAVANIINAHMRKGDLGFSNTSMIAVAQKGTDLGTFKTKSDNASSLPTCTLNTPTSSPARTLPRRTASRPSTIWSTRSSPSVLPR